MIYFIISGGVEADGPCGPEIGAAADLLFTSGVNMDVQIEQECAERGSPIDCNSNNTFIDR